MFRLRVSLFREISIFDSFRTIFVKIHKLKLIIRIASKFMMLFADETTARAV